MNTFLPTIDFFGTQISKLILGGNAVSGNSHRTCELDNEMLDYFTTKHIKVLLHACESNGINTFQFRGDRHIIRIIHEYRNEGGEMHWICQTASEYSNFQAMVQSALSQNPIAFYIHGTHADNYFKAKQIDLLKKELGILRETGLPVGLGSHMPQVLREAEEQNWDVDFYMSSMFNVYKTTPGWRESYIVSGQRLPETYDDADRDEMLSFVQQTTKPCLLFKIYAGGHRAATYEERRNALQYVIAKSKPQDALVVGMFPKHSDQVKENVMLINELFEGSIS